MMTRTAKMLLLAGVALYYTLVVLNNLTDFDSNYEYVRHVLSMDTTFPGNHGMWRALTSPAWHLTFYFAIIAWEMITMILLWWGAVSLIRVLRQLLADVAGGLSHHWRGVVSYVAVAHLGRARVCFPHVCRGGLGAAHPVAAGHRKSTVTQEPLQPSSGGIGPLRKRPATLPESAAPLRSRTWRRVRRGPW
jgi:predicted small integral membrane protein